MNVKNYVIIALYLLSFLLVMDLLTSILVFEGGKRYSFGLVRRIWVANIQFFKILKEVIKSFNTVKGIISFVISFTIVVGWAGAFIVIGFISKDAKMVGAGSAVIGFWATPGPQSPMWGLIIVLTMLIQRFILRDKKALKWKDISLLIKRMNEKEGLN